MLFAHQEITSLTDTQENFEQLQTLGILNRQLATGTVTLTWTGGQASSAATITHGLPGTPTYANLSATDTTGPSFVFAQTSALGATTFQAQAVFLSSTWTGTKVFNWIAIL